MSFAGPDAKTGSPNAETGSPNRDSFFLFLAVFIVGDLSDVSGANRSISGASSSRSVLGEPKLSYDTRKLGSVSIGKGDRTLQVRMPRLEVRMPRLEVRTVIRLVGMILRKILFPRS